VDTVIVFRACVPLLVSAADYLWLGRELPSCRSFGAMLIVGLGAIGYVLIDSAFALSGVAAYGWVSLYFVAIAAEMVLGKMITSSVQVQLGVQVFLTNAMSLPLMLIIGTTTGELGKFNFDVLNASNLPLLTVSCIVGAGIGFSGWWCRSLVSATSFTVIGILNKLLTVFLNILVWDNHSSTIGTLCLLGCLVGGSLYKQAPMRVLRVEPIASSPKSPIPVETVVIEMQEIEAAQEPSELEAQRTERLRNPNPVAVVVAKLDEEAVVDDPKAL
jgi:GDP-mannose transporter